MAEDIEVLVAQLSADFRSYQQAMSRMNMQTTTALQRVENQFTQMGGRVDRVFAGVGRSAARMMAGLGAVFSVRAFSRITQDSLQAAESIADLSRQVNASTEGLQEVRFVLDQNGSSAAAADRMLARLATTAGDVLRGKVDEGTRALQQMGISQRILRGELQTSDDVFVAIVQRMETITDANTRASLSSAIFGRRLGAELTQALSIGGAELDRFIQKARDMNLVLGRDLVQAGAEANATMRAMRESINAERTAAVLEHADALLKMAEALAEITKWGVRAGALIGNVYEAGQNARAFIDGRAPVGADGAQSYRDAAAAVRSGASQREIESILGRGVGRNQARHSLGSLGVDPSPLTGRSPLDRMADEQRAWIADMLDGFAEAEGHMQGLRDEAGRLRNTLNGEGGGLDLDDDDAAARASEREAEQQRQLSLARERIALELVKAEAEARGDAAAAQRYQRELDLMTRTEAYRSAEIENYAELARMDHERLTAAQDDAAIQERINDLIEARRELLGDEAQLREDIDLARLRRDEATLRDKERELYILQRSAELVERIENMSASDAREIAGREWSARESARQLGDFKEEFRNAFRDGLLGALDGNAKEAFSNWLRDAATRGLGQALDAIAERLFETLFSGSKGSGGGLLGSIFGAFGFGGARAAGGPVYAGKAYRVGEKGPETFVPTRPGMVLPTSFNVPQRAAGAVHVHNHFSLHAEGAVMTDELLAQMDQKAAQAGIGAVNAAKRIVPAHMSEAGRYQRAK